jgi:hypothetical protein
MAYYHRKHDREFSKQWEEAREYGIEMLHARAFQRAVEGDLEPIVYMGVTTGYIRRFDTKLQIEMLRAYRPERFRTPGTNINVGTKTDVFVLTEEQRHELQRMHRACLEAHPPAPQLAAGSQSSQVPQGQHTISEHRPNESIPVLEG